MSEEKLSGIQSQVKLQMDVSIAAKTVSWQIASLIPYLEKRKMTARKMQEYNLTPTDAENFRQLLEYQNNEIKRILGL